MANLDVFRELTDANTAYAATSHRVVPVMPARHLAVLTCMDVRIDPLRAFGLDLGEAHVLRNAGARVTPDVLRSLALSAHLLGTRAVALVAHTTCGVLDPEGTVPDRLAAAMGREPAGDEWHTFADPRQALRDDADILLRWADRPDDLVVGAYLFDVESGRLEPVVEPTAADAVG